MKKKIGSILVMVFLCMQAEALPMGNPSEAALFTHGIYAGEESEDRFSWSLCTTLCDAWSIRMGFYGNYVFDRHLRVKEGEWRGKVIEDTEIFTNSAYFALNFYNLIDVFTTVGGSNLYLMAERKIFGDTVDIIAEETYFDWLVFVPEFSWSIGGRAIFWECKCFTIGIEGEYFRTQPKVNYIQTFGNIFAKADEFSTTYSEWQVGAGISYRIATAAPTVAFIPYFAITWSGVRVDGITLTDVEIGEITTTFSIPDLRADKLWGYVVGTSFTLCDMVGVTAEGRFGSEKALYINGQFRF